MAEYAQSKQGARRRQFKPIIEASDARKKREENAVELRKSKRQESVAKIRNTADATDRASVSFSPVGVSEVQVIANELKKADPATQRDATQRLRKLLSSERNAPIQEAISCGIVPLVISFLRPNADPKLQFEAAWAITNLSSGTEDQTQFVIRCGAVPALCELLFSPHDEVLDQAIWALGNIAGDSIECRDIVLSYNMLPALLQVFEQQRSTQVLKRATWTISNFCRGKPQPPWEIVGVILPVLCKLIHSADTEILTDACWALSFLSDGPNERLQPLLEPTICKRIVELLLHSSPHIQGCALRIVGNIVTGDDSQTQKVLDCGLVPQLHSLLKHPKKNVKKEALWTISNITAGNKMQVQTVMEERLFPRLVSYMKGPDFELKREAAWALSNATSSASIDQIRHLVEAGIIEPMCELLTSTDPRMILVGLEALDNVLKGGTEKDKTGVGSYSRMNPYASRIESCGGLDKIESLQTNTNTTVYEKAVSILEEHFAAEEEDQNVAPNANSVLHSFQFGTVVASHFNF